MAFGSSQSFEPRLGTVQFIFGVIYAMITLIALCLAFYVVQDGGEPYIHYFMAALFGIMAIKSFVIHKKVKDLLKNGVYYPGKVDSIEPVRGITIIKGVVDVKDHGLIYIESRLVGESVAHELKTFMQDYKLDSLPALVVGTNTKKPRGLFTIKCNHGHLDPASAVLQGTTLEELEQIKNQDSAFDETTAKAKEQTRLQEQAKQESKEENQVNKETQVQSKE